MNNKNNIEWFVFITTAVILLGVCIPLVMAPEWGKETVATAFRFVTQQFGFIYIWASMAVVVLLLWLALGRYGRVKLGAANAPPDFSTFSWASMLFCSGIGTAILYWSPIEWVYYYQQPPFGLSPGSSAAIEWAASYGIFHWGFTGWAFYCLPAVAIAYAYHVRQIPHLRTSTACQAVLGRQSNRLPGRIIDVLFMVGLIGAAGTGIGFGTPLISASISNLFGVPDDF